MSNSLDRRFFLRRAAALAGTLGLGGCDGLSDQPWVRRVLDSAEGLTRFTQTVLIPPSALAREYDEAEISKEFKANGSTNRMTRLTRRTPPTALPIGSSWSMAWSTSPRP